MSLYIRLRTNFFSHVKTLRLKAALGNDAFWIPPRLWVYAAEHQPDGNLSKYSAEEIAMLVGYQGDAQAMLDALLRASFLDSDPLRIHGWQEHNGYHQSFSERASKAANARWKGKDKKRQEMKGEDMTQAYAQASASNAPSNAQASKRLYGIPATAEEVVAFGKTLNPRKGEKVCRDFFAHYEGQAKENPNGEVFWITSGSGAVITNWKVKLPSFGDEPKARRNGGGNSTQSNHQSGNL